MDIYLRNIVKGEEGIDPKNATVNRWYTGEESNDYYWCIGEDKNARKIFIVHTKHSSFRVPFKDTSEDITERVLEISSGVLIVGEYSIEF